MDIIIKNIKVELEQVVLNSKSFFCLLFLVMLMARSINLYNLLPQIFDTTIFSLIAIIGLLLIVINLTFCKFKNQDRILFFFWIAIIISAVFNIKYGFFNNCKEIIWRAVCFFLVFPNKKNDDLLISKIKKWVIIFCTFFSFLSLITYIFQTNFYINLQPENSMVRIDPFRFGFVENRLFGIYFNPNTGATMAFLSIIFAFENLCKFNVFCIIVQFVFIILSGSRVVIVASLVTLFITIWAILQNRINFKDDNDKNNILVCVFVSLLFCTGFYFFIKFLKEILGFIPPLMIKLFNIKEVSNYRLNMNRLDIKESKDISNLRFSIWISAFEIFKKTFIFGTSQRNIISFAIENLPNTFIAKTKYSAIHNSYIGVFVYTGIFGAVWFYIFLVKYTSKIFNILVKYIENINSITKENKTIILSLISIMIFGVFEPDIIFLNNVYTLILWLFLGSLTNYKISDRETK